MWERSEEDRLELITPEKFEAFENSQTARDAIILLGKLSGAHNVEITQSQYTLLRDFLLVEISIDNANRAGVLSNMTLKELSRATAEDVKKKCQKCQMYVYSGHALSYTKLVHRHATQTEGNKYFK